MTQDDRLTSIITQIKSLFELAADADDAESQLAFAMAQKLMIKYHVEQDDLGESDEDAEPGVRPVTPFKGRRIWWEARLAGIVTGNFRCDYIWHNHYDKNTGRVSRQIRFVGFPADIEMATEIYLLAHDAVGHWTDRYVAAKVNQAKYLISVGYYVEGASEDMRAFTREARENYRAGFLEGIKRRMAAQLREMSDSTALVVQTPAAVAAYVQKITDGSALKPTRVTFDAGAADYAAGSSDGEQIDWSKKTIDEQVQQWG